MLNQNQDKRMNTTEVILPPETSQEGTAGYYDKRTKGSIPRARIIEGNPATGIER